MHCQTDLPLATFGARYDEAGVGQVTLPLLGCVDERAPALDVQAVPTDGGIDGHGVGPLRLLGSAVALNLATLGIAEREKNIRKKIRKKKFKITRTENSRQWL